MVAAALIFGYFFKIAKKSTAILAHIGYLKTPFLDHSIALHFKFFAI